MCTVMDIVSFNLIFLQGLFFILAYGSFELVLVFGASLATDMCGIAYICTCEKYRPQSRWLSNKSVRQVMIMII